MFGSPIPQSCPPYAPASQVTPESVDELPTQEIDIFTQAENSNRILFDNDEEEKEQNTKSRNYYEQLFSLDSDDEEEFSFAKSIDDASLTTKDSNSQTLFYDDISKTSSSSDMSISTTDSTDDNLPILNINESIECMNLHTQGLFPYHSNDSSEKNASHTSAKKFQPAHSFLPEEEINKLLGYEQKLPPPIKQECQSMLNTSDNIISFNIRNKFDHTTAAELMTSCDITFASFQEPFGAQHKVNASWTAFTQRELQSARYICFETRFQVILYDSMKWGGKSIENFSSELDGRITSIAFEFDNKQQLGIISLYACSADTHSTNPTLKNINEKILKNLKSIRHRWTSKFPNMTIITMGDFQETLSSSNRDNIGNFRKEQDSNGILSYVADSSTSIVRERNELTQYITRFGSNGGRGIDHIFVDSQDENLSAFTSAKICRLEGSKFFPSDHSMLSCTFSRLGPHNNMDGIPRTKYDYRKIYSIKVKGTGNLGENIRLDESQYKSSKNFAEQKKLFQQVQDLTDDNSNLTNESIGEIESRISELYTNLWNSGKEQKIKGVKNELVEINEEQATELSYIFRKFQNAVKDVLDELKLSSTQDPIDKAGRTRARLRRKNGFKLFMNLPISTKLRYLRSSVRTKLNSVRRAIYWLEEFEIKDKHTDQEPMSESEFWEIRDEIVKTSILEDKAKDIQNSLMQEIEERANHITALQFMKKKSQELDQNRTKQTESDKDTLPNTLPYISENITKLMNSWLSESNCTNHFNIASKNDPLEALSFEISNWKVPLSDFIDPISMRKNHNFFLKVKSYFITCKNQIISLNNKITRIQTMYRKDTLQYFLQSNTIHSFTNKVLPKSRSAPAAHSLIWDETIQAQRRCKNEAEELQATSEHHGHWMGDSKATENCAFAKVIKKGKLGPRGIELLPNRRITMKDLPKLIHNSAKLPRRIKRAFIKAHNKHTANLFRAPKQSRTIFNYPFFLRKSSGLMNKSTFIESHLWKCLASVPGKARFDGFQLATIGRFGSRWRKALLNIIKIIFIMRYIPAELKQIQRFPIPKPGKTNEYRPISLCNDLYCFINAMQTKLTSATIEKAGILHPGITSYRKGKSCATLVAVEQSFREDCFENKFPCVQIDEDEENFFDRVCIEIILASMKINGFPDQGFLEMKACAMGEKLVEIITCKGVAFAKFICGLEQGNPDSPTIANLVIKLKHDVWHTVSKGIQKIFNNNPKVQCDSYKFGTFDIFDGPLIICMIGYCDDNSKFLSAKNEDDLIELVNFYIQLAGDLSMVTKIGRKSSKCDIQFFNVSAEFTMKLQKCWSTAWSFIHDSPIEEQVPFKVQMQPEQLRRFMQISNYFELTLDEQIKWDKIIKPEPHRHLGLSGTLDGDSSLTCSKTIEKMYERIGLLKIHSMDPDSQRTCSNMLVASMHSYVPIQANYCQQELSKLDAFISNQIMKRNGISTTDCKHRIFLPICKGGLGFKSTLEVDVIAVARELEVISNGSGIDCWAFRSRLSAIKKYKGKDETEIRNHARTAMLKLAKYGIHVRDKYDGILNWMLEIIAKTCSKFASIGSDQYNDGTSYSTGYGRKSNNMLALGGIYHSHLKNLKENNWTMTPNIQSGIKHLEKINSIENINDIRCKAGQLRFDQLTSLHSFYEWVNEDTCPRYRNIPSCVKEWTKIDLSKKCNPHNEEKNLWTWSEDRIQEKMNKHLHLNFQKQIRFDLKAIDEFKFNNYATSGRILSKIFHSKGPLIIATDGAHEQKNPSNGIIHKTSAAFCICTLDIREGESIHSTGWLNRPMIPIYSRTSHLPTNIGTSTSDIAHGEGYAFVMEKLAIDADLDKITITDSNAVRNNIINLRESESIETDREYIRTFAGGISKYLCSILNSTKVPSNDEDSDSQQSQTDNPSWCWFKKVMLVRKNIFLEIASSWVQQYDSDDSIDNNSDISWKREYFDNHPHHSILKVNSHQLNNSGTAKKQNPRYNQLCPNLALLSANHHADRAADCGIKFDRFTRETNFDVPQSDLRFSLTWNGLVIDRHISSFLWSIFTQERIKKLKKKKTQGLLWRILHLSATNWKKLLPKKGLLRLLLGVSNTHNRCIYKSDIIRSGILNEYLTTILDVEKREAIKLSSKTNQISYLLTCKRCKNNNCIHKEGNTRHMLLYCNNEKLASFRTKMTNLIEARLKHFFYELLNKSSPLYISKILYEISNIFCGLQQQQQGRLESIPTLFNNQYTAITELMKKNEINNISQALWKSKSLLLSELLGLLPEESSLKLTDYNIGTVELPWLGLIPKSINKFIMYSITNIRNLAIDKSFAEEWRVEMIDEWKEITSIIMGKAMGLHNISGSITRELEKKYEHDAELKLQATTANSEIQHDSNRDTTNIKRGAKKRPVCELETKKCISVSCGSEHKIWLRGKSLNINYIPITHKQCQRCANYSTAMRAAIETFELMKESEEKVGQKTLIKIRTYQTIGRIKYNSLMDMLHEYYPSIEYFGKARFISKNRLSEKSKKICHIIINTVKHFALLQNMSFKQSIQFMIKHIQSTLSQITSQATKDRQTLKRLKTIPPNVDILPHQESSPPSSQAPIKTPTPNHYRSQNPVTINLCSEETNSSPLSPKLSTSIVSDFKIAVRGRMLEGQHMFKAIEVLKSKYSSSGVFIASPEAYLTITQWEPIQGWQAFARTFRSNTAMNHRPNGHYLIPIFSGPEEAGHWYLVVIIKQTNFKKGVIFDSIGNGNVHNNTILHTLNDIFAPGRGRVYWESCSCVQQIELECGHRTILAMQYICEGLSKGDEFENCSAMASLQHPSIEQAYDPANIRLRVRDIINEFRPDMVRAPIRNRRFTRIDTRSAT